MIVHWFFVLLADPQLYANQVAGVITLSLYVGAACIVLGIVPSLLCKGIDSRAIENTEEISPKTLAKNFFSVIDGIKQAFNNIEFVKLCGATFLIFNGFQLVASFAYFIIVFHMFNGDYGLTGIWPALYSTATAIVTAFMVIPVVSWMATKWGKRNAFVISTAISMFGYCLKWYGFNPDNPWMLFMPIPFMAFGIGGLFTLMLSMTADVCDQDELKNGMPRKEGTFGAIYWLMVKFGQAIALMLGGVVLKLVGFDPALSTQAAETITYLRIADIVIPVVTAGFAIWIMWTYALDEERAQSIKQQLIATRGEI